MYLNLIAAFLIIIEHLVKIFTQNVPPISPCPKMFQYRFDGNEWFGLLSVRNPEFGQMLNLQVTLSLRGKPATNFLGDIELLTRGQFQSDLPVIYKIKFAKSRFPPKLTQIAVNKQIVCYGPTDHSVLLTQIVLEHTRKFTFLSDDVDKLPSNVESATSSSTPITPQAVSANGVTNFYHQVDKFPSSGLKDSLYPLQSEMNSKHQLNNPLNLEPVRISKDDCGIVDSRVRYQVLNFIQYQYKNLRNSNSELPESQEKENEPDENNLNNGPILIFGNNNTNDVEEDYVIKKHNDNLPIITRGAWPWLAAIYVNNITSLTYQCSGTLVSHKIILSAAHCFQLFKKFYSANEVLIFLGRHNLRNWNEESSLAAPVDDIYIHPDYNRQLNNYDGDIAIIVLKNRIHFNTFIRPACLWSGPPELQYIVGEQGVVAGWSRNNQSMTDYFTQHTIPRIINSPIISNEECFKANKLFENISSNRTFCAGLPPLRGFIKDSNSFQQKERTAPCMGDSGAGLLLHRNNHWVLRGIVTGSILKSPASNNETAACNLNHFVIHTDVAQFLDWIYAFILR